MPEIVPIDDHITAIDHELFGLPGLGYTYVVRGDPDQVALVETGTSLTAPHTLAGLDQLGIPREAIRAILCTHIHMDHSGGAAPLAMALPNASVYINSASAVHLVDPTRLLASTRRTIGEDFWHLQGTMLPLPPDRLRPAESLRLELGRNIVLHALPTPGHSPDHLAYLEERAGVLFAGDSCGTALPRYGMALRPTMPPPSFDLEQQIATYERLRALPFARLLVTHQGDVGDPAAMLRQNHTILLDVVAAVRTAIERDELDVPTLARRLLPPPDNSIARNWSEMTIAGIAYYLRKRQVVIGSSSSSATE